VAHRHLRIGRRSMKAAMFAAADPLPWRCRAGSASGTRTGPSFRSGPRSPRPSSRRAEPVRPRSTHPIARTIAGAVGASSPVASAGPRTFASSSGCGPPPRVSYVSLSTFASSALEPRTETDRRCGIFRDGSIWPARHRRDAGGQSNHCLPGPLRRPGQRRLHESSAVDPVGTDTVNSCRPGTC
jgi:hypothetical protein